MPTDSHVIYAQNFSHVHMLMFNVRVCHVSKNGSVMMITVNSTFCSLVTLML